MDCAKLMRGVAMNATGRLAASLAMIAGYVDAYGYLTYKTFLSFMSGNTTIAGYSLAQDRLSSALPSLIAILAFVIGSSVGTKLDSNPRPQPRRAVFALVAALMTTVMTLARVTDFTALAQIGVMSLAMGMLNTTITRVGAQPVNVAFVTGTLSRLGSHLALAWRRAPLQDAASGSDTHARRAAALAGVWSAFLAGAFLAGMTTPRFATWTLVPPTAALLVLALFHRE